TLVHGNDTVLASKVHWPWPLRMSTTYTSAVVRRKCCIYTVHYINTIAWIATKRQPLIWHIPEYDPINNSIWITCSQQSTVHIVILGYYVQVLSGLVKAFPSRLSKLPLMLYVKQIW